MARILLGWELGGGHGHHVKLAGIAERLRARGHRVVFAGQHLGGWPADAEVWQAPLWPAQVATLARPPAAPPATMGDIFAGIGIGDAAATLAVVSAWDRLLAAIRPDVVAAEYAPGLLLAAYGRVPTLALGSGFTLPPADLPAFPSLTGHPRVHDEAPMLAEINRALVVLGRPVRNALPAVLRADRAMSSVFAELDPYGDVRRGGYGAPSATVVVPPERPGDEIFVYMNGAQPRPAGFWQGLATCGTPVRVYDPRLTAADRTKLEAAGITTEPRPIPFARIAARSTLVLSHCGLGFACSALIAGLPHIVAPYDLEKQLIGAALEALGLGRRVAAASYEADSFAALLRETVADDDLRTRVRAASPDFTARMALPPTEEAARILDEMVTA